MDIMMVSPKAISLNCFIFIVKMTQQWFIGWRRRQKIALFLTFRMSCWNHVTKHRESYTCNQGDNKSHLHALYFNGWWGHRRIWRCMCTSRAQSKVKNNCQWLERLTKHIHTSVVCVCAHLCMWDAWVISLMTSFVLPCCWTCKYSAFLVAKLTTTCTLTV